MEPVVEEPPSLAGSSISLPGAEVGYLWVILSQLLGSHPMQATPTLVDARWIAALYIPVARAGSLLQLGRPPGLFGDDDGTKSELM
ncbi:hypothetical protein NM208_g16440 [Fusarium decemcellulare]|uniref:Uncharacterized protein n=1 Tax=Fusarium decemcellulare TaxID=57161 RepID=A0ACC1RDN5_9HYPO|nr:hypothetical protein NM208_g16440 [Fusarium decemcellulare]